MELEQPPLVHGVQGADVGTDGAGGCNLSIGSIERRKEQMIDVKEMSKAVAEALGIDDLKKVARIVQDELIRREVRSEIRERFMTTTELLQKIKRGDFADDEIE
jgi:hypothetical protein